MGDVVAIMPASDAPATTLAAWGAEVVRRARGSGHTIIHQLTGSAATQPAVHGILSQGDVLMYFGHGTWTTLEGAQTLVDGTSAASVAVPIVVAVACESAQTLGVQVTAANQGSYLGFDDELLWLTEAAYMARFQDAVVAGLDLLLASNPIADVATELENQFDQIYQHYRYGVPRANPDRVVGYLAADWDRQHVTLVGSQTTALPAPRAPGSVPLIPGPSSGSGVSGNAGTPAREGATTSGSLRATDIAGHPLLRQLVAESLLNVDLRQRLLADPKMVLRKAGLVISDDAKVVIHQNHPNEIHIVLP